LWAGTAAHLLKDEASNMGNAECRAQPGEQPSEHPAVRPHPSKLFVEVTTRCNLRCAMCVKQAPGQQLVDGDMSDETFARLAPALPRLDALVLNGVGESLLHPRLEKYIEAAKKVMAPQAWVGFQTNGQLLGRERAASLVRAGVDKVCVSADAVAPEVFRKLRGGGKHAAVETALGALHAAASESGRAISLGVEFVAMRSNVDQLPDLVRWAARNHVGFVIVTHMLPYNEGMAGAAAFDSNSDRALQVFREWKGRAGADGVDVDRYFDVFMKFHRSPEEERVVEYVGKMVEDASSQGISLNLAQLLRCDEPMLRRVRDIFDEAEEIARRENVDLRLPATSPKHDKRCDFVEDGSAFVSWEGDLHPCYFLWHRYRCYIGGAVKQVRPQSFGNLKEQDVLGIWNGAAWSTFREQARKYEYPSCSDCNVALCDYVQGEDFTQDCHLGKVPCPTCLWCTGVFQCLR
jgi:putative metalloenzyme radical SAM/SPASM domain maturase